jgi:hypothetical protein
LREAPAAGLEPALSRLTVACLTDSTTPEQRRQQDSNLRGGGPPYAVARRCLPNSAMSPRRKERESNPQGPCGPTRFRDGIPLPWQSFQVAPAGVEPATSRLRVGCSAELSYGARVWSAGIEPAAPRVSGERSTGLSYDHKSGQGWDRTSDLLFVRQALVPTELLALDPGQGIEPRPPGSEPGVLPVRRSRNAAGGRHGAWRPPAS